MASFSNAMLKNHCYNESLMAGYFSLIEFLITVKQLRAMLEQCSRNEPGKLHPICYPHKNCFFYFKVNKRADFHLLPCFPSDKILGLYT